MNKYVLCIIICFILYLLAIQIRKMLIYHPLKYIKEDYAHFYSRLKNFTEFTVGDVHGIIVNNSKKKYLLICHGNGGNITSLSHYINMFSKHVNLVLFDYSTFGKSQGDVVSEKVMKQNIISVYNYLSQDLEIDEITIMGESMGASIAIWFTGFLANTYKIKLNSLIIQSGFSKIADLTPNLSRMFFLDYNVEESIKMIADETKVLVLHSPDDTLVPFEHGLQIYNLFMADKKTQSNVYFHEMSGNHNNLYFDSNYLSVVRHFL